MFMTHGKFGVYRREEVGGGVYIDSSLCHELRKRQKSTTCPTLVTDPFNKGKTNI